MNQFIQENPALVAWFLGALFTLISLLGTLLVYFVKRAFDNLTLAIQQLRDSIDEKADDIGVLKDRMKGVETRCEMQRERCPVTGHSFPPRNPIVAQVQEAAG